MSFLNFLHEPEIEILEKPARELVYHLGKAKHRIKAPRRVVEVRGTLRQYVKKLFKGHSFTYSHRFWVRGHWRHLKHKRFKQKRGQIIWIPPYIKGQGSLIEKRYKLTEPYSIKVPKTEIARKIRVKKRCPRCGLRYWLVIEGKEAKLIRLTGYYVRKVKEGQKLM